MVDFLGYQEAKVPTPIIRTNEVHATARVWDGQMLVLRMTSITNLVHTMDRVPLLADLPLIGRLFQHESAGIVVRQRLVLITPEMTDPTGKRLNDPKHLPFDPATLP